MMDRSIKLHEREFEVVPEAWRLLVDAFHQTAAHTSSAKMVPALQRMNEVQLEELLHSDFSTWGGGSQARLEEFDVHRLEETVRQVLYRWLRPEVRDRVVSMAARPHRHG
tara:strand:+ start:6380 stop:6709 length:330 start_codon:yes stop_codon:yes gene_type:complete